MTLVLAGREYVTDKDGYLQHPDDWTPDLAEVLARHENIVLTAEHWEVINLLRSFYQTYQLAPAMRPLVKYLGQTLGPDKGRSIYLHQLFPPSPARQASKIAGLPRPTNCL